MAQLQYTLREVAELQFSPRDLWKAIKDLRTLAASPEGRRMLAGRLEDVIRRSKIGGSLLDKVTLMYCYFRDPAEPLGSKLMIGAALLYLVIPNDLLPDWLPVIGFTDDFAAIAIVWNRCKDVLLNYDERRQARVVGEC